MQLILSLFALSDVVLYKAASMVKDTPAIYLAEPHAFRIWGVIKKAASMTSSNDMVKSTYLENYLDSPVSQLLPTLQTRILNETMYWGIPTQKNPNDLWVYQNIIFEQRPDVIIEIGTRNGGSALALAHFCSLIGKGRVISIDNNQVGVAEVVKNHPLITLLEGEAYDLFGRVVGQVNSGDTTLIIADSAHTDDDMLRILQAYSALIRPGGYFIVESGSIHPRTDTTPGIPDAPAKFIESHPEFQIDRSRELFLITSAMRGFLKRQDKMVNTEAPLSNSPVTESSAELRQLQQDWNYLGEVDPLWAILSNPNKLGGHWNLSEFFETGVSEIDAIMNYMRSLGVPLPHKNALDFGCGVGRLTQALCRYFEQCAGVDIAASMVERARTLNSYSDRCRYYLNSADDLSLFSSNQFDFIYSNIVFQHMPPQYTAKYLKECMRVLEPGGIFIFQIPSHLAPAVRSSAATNYLPARALTNREFRARIQLLQSPESAPAGTAVTIRAKVKNESGSTWPVSGDATGKYSIKLANHWRDAAGKLIALDDGRTVLPKDLNAQEEVELDLVVHTPRTEGQYTLELDLVQEIIAWFGDRGSARTPVGFKVTAAPHETLLATSDAAKTEAEQAASTLPSYIKMFQVTRPEVEQMMKEYGAELLDIRENQAAGPEWVSFQYCARKRN